MRLYSQDIYKKWVKNTEEKIDAVMRLYWEYAKADVGLKERHALLVKADKLVGLLERHRKQVYNP